MGLILAKNHMVTKQHKKPEKVYLQSYSSKKSYGNKTRFLLRFIRFMSYSSKKSYGNKTCDKKVMNEEESYSSKKSYGNKTPF